MAQVRGTVRDANNKEKVAHLNALGNTLPGKLTLYAADLLKEGSFDEVVRCEDSWRFALQTGSRITVYNHEHRLHRWLHARPPRP